ncbi:hypothetical protein AAYR18_03155 [Leuconostoc fallax]|uniref:hypothetical protein n=1 Tax=Leuconostoc fallax TaxID=1251 RepID=UPI0020917359|nr:hypothetical protein [Leuconostoc fallax]MCO6183679.1 hypothetical protein [Leuconostoc fallax]
MKIISFTENKNSLAITTSEKTITYSTPSDLAVLLIDLLDANFSLNISSKLNNTIETLTNYILLTIYSLNNIENIEKQEDLIVDDFFDDEQQPVQPHKVFIKKPFDDYMTYITGCYSNLYVLHNSMKKIIMQQKWNGTKELSSISDSIKTFKIIRNKLLVHPEDNGVLLYDDDGLVRLSLHSLKKTITINFVNTENEVMEFELASTYKTILTDFLISFIKILLNNNLNQINGYEDETIFRTLM